MDFNTFFIRFGLDSSNFTNKPVEIVETSTGFIYEVEEEYKQRICPHCNHQSLHIHSYKWRLLNKNIIICDENKSIILGEVLNK